MKKLFIASAALAALALPAAASAATTITVTPGTTTAGLPSNNDFDTELAGLGYDRVAHLGTTLFLNGPSRITFEFLGSESGYNDTYTFSLNGATLTEVTGFQNNFAAPVAINPPYVLGGPGPLNLFNSMNFTSNNGTPATVGDSGFGVYLPIGFAGGDLTSIVFGYDDGGGSPDDNDWDDFIVRATVTAVPEPTTWAMMILGLGLTGAAMRRRRQSVSVRYA